MLRFLRLNEGVRPRLSIPAHSVRSLEPNRTFLWSAGWNFAIVNRVHTNNLGFVNDQDYVVGQPGPLLALIGDSYVEALMVPFRAARPGDSRLVPSRGMRVFIRSARRARR